MAEEQGPENLEGSQTQPITAPKSIDLNVGGNVEGNLIIGDNNVIHYYAAVATNTEKHEPDFWALKHPYPMPPNFTGRIHERVTLTQWLKEDSENRLFILRALGGFGKSALTWQWITYDVMLIQNNFQKLYSGLFMRATQVSNTSLMGRSNILILNCLKDCVRK